MSKATKIIIAIVICLVAFFALNLITTGRLLPCSHSWESATCTDPAVCSKCGKTTGSPLGHDWKNATCTDPKTCIRCGETEGDPMGHLWDEATCTSPKTCTRCHITEGEALGHAWAEATMEHPQMCSRCGETVPQELPANGAILIGRNLGGRSSITINCSDSTQSYYVKLKDSSGKTVLSFFVRAGQSATVPVPASRYQAYFACGDEWYGTDSEYLFGENTHCSKDDEFVDFSQYTITYTLYSVTGGNFEETPISPDDF